MNRNGDSDPGRKVKKVKLSASDRLEAAVRREYVPNEIVRSLNEIIGIEVNAAWRGTPEGLKAAKREHGYEPAELKLALKKQEEHKANLQEKVDFLKQLLDKQEK